MHDLHREQRAPPRGGGGGHHSGSSAPFALPPPLQACLRGCGLHWLQGDLVAAGVLSGNRNFEGRVHPNTRANYLASPPLVIAYALAGTVRIDFEREPLGVDSEGRDVYLREIWPSREEIQEVERTFVIPSMFQEVYQKIEVMPPAAVVGRPGHVHPGD